MAVDPRAASTARLAQSRRAIAAWLNEDAAVPDRPAVMGAAGVALRAVVAGLLRRPPSPTPQTLTLAAADATQALLRPVARRHPWALVGGAVLAGAGAAAVLPRRWLWQPALLTGLLGPMVVQALTAAADARATPGAADTP